MNKRLTKTDYLLTLLILFIVVASLAAFFYGVKVGRDKTAEKYERILAEREELESDSTAYHQQHLVSFYHTVFLPYAEFRNKWFEHLETIDINSGSVDPETLLKELERLAREKFREAEPMAMPAASPLLREAHDHYLKSLKLFAEALDRFKPGGRTGGALIAAIEGDEYFREAENFGLVAQNLYYDAIVAWHASVDFAAESRTPVRDADLAVTDWAKLDLNRKNAFIARIMAENGYFEPYLPQDLTLRVDEMILDGRSGALDMTTIAPIADMLVATDAVRSGDFLRKRDKFYKGETLPQLPFYSF